MRTAISQSITPEERTSLDSFGLDALAELDASTLREHYARAAVPALSALEGDLVGRMLAVQGVGPFLFRLLRAFAAWRHFPWRGKSFAARPLATRGDGINRVIGDDNPRRWFRFETFIGPSRADAGQALQLDYDNASNPFFIRAIKDELRQLKPGLFLGQAYLVWFGKPRLVLHFGLASQSLRPVT
jgi:hypothetical protein